MMQEPLDLEKEYLTSRQWGSLFTDDHTVPNCNTDKTKTYMNTLWGYIIRKYADVAVPQLEYISGLYISTGVSETVKGQGHSL